MPTCSPLPEEIRKYIRDVRCVSDEIIDRMQLQWIEKYKGFPWIILPIFDAEGKVADHKYKKPPSSKSDRKTLNQAGSKATLYNLPCLREKIDRIVITESEWSVLALLSLGIKAVSSTCGASTFKEEWVELFPQGIDVITAFDNDDAGENGKKKIHQLLWDKRPDLVLHDAILNKDQKEGYDVGDFLLDCKNTGLNQIEEFTKLIRPVAEPVEAESAREIARVRAPKKKTTYADWQSTISSNFPDLIEPAEACLSVTCQLLINDITNCFALVLVDVPSAGKTIVINFFDEIEGITYSSDTFTPAAFVSNASNVSKDKLAQIDLLPRIKQKTLLVRDMATILSAREDDLMKNMGILTRVLDGEGLSTDTGVHGRRALRGDYVFMLIAGSTPIEHRVWKTMGTLGPRIFFLNLHGKNKSIEELTGQLRKQSYKTKERDCRSITKLRLYTLWNAHPKGIDWNRENDPQECLEVIARCAQLLARLRGQVKVFKDPSETDSKELGHSVPIVERPDRINQTLYNLARGHAVAVGRTNISTDDLSLVLRVTIDSAPGNRARVFRELLSKDGLLRTGDIQELMKCSDDTARREMATLSILGLCEEEDGDALNFDPANRIRIKSEFEWFLSEEGKRYLNPTQGQKIADTPPQESDPVLPQ